MLIIITIFFFLISCSPDTTDPEEITETPDITVISRAEKIEQLVGDFDRERQDSAVNLTETKYGLISTDLGIPFQHNDRTFILFGDSFGGAEPNDDAIAYTTDTNPENGIDLTFIHNLNGHYRPIQIPDIDQGAYEVPVEGVSVNEYLYIYHTTDWNETTQNMERTVLARSENNGYSFQYIDDISLHYFINISLVEVDFSDWQGFPFQQDQGLVLFGTGEYRNSSVYLACQKSENIEDPASLQYFTGVNSSNVPQWSSNESDAVPLFNQSGIGEFSAFYYSEFNRWIMLYNNMDPRGINIRAAHNPWGPWSDVQVIFDPWEDEGYGHFIHVSWEYANMDSVHDPGRENEWGGEYGPYQFGNLAIDSKNILTIYFTMSTWNPYTVVLMKTVLGKE
ncbi:MAG: DUF4185 domain-containing protein [bacterium]